MLFDQLKKDRIQALKDKQVIKKDVLGVVIGDAAKEDKNPSDEKVIATIKKILKGVEELKEHILKAGAIETHDTYIQCEIEREVLESYLPKQLNRSGIEIAIKAAINLGENNIGSIMKYLKENYAGRYDGKLASEVAKELL